MGKKYNIFEQIRIAQKGMADAELKSKNRREKVDVDYEKQHRRALGLDNKLPNDHICPSCGWFIPENSRWVVKTGCIPVCRSCNCMLLKNAMPHWVKWHPRKLAECRANQLVGQTVVADQMGVTSRYVRKLEYVGYGRARGETAERVIRAFHALEIKVPQFLSYLSWHIRRSGS